MKVKLQLMALAVITGLSFVAGVFILVDALTHRDLLGSLCGGGAVVVCGWLMWNGGPPEGGER